MAGKSVLWLRSIPSTKPDIRRSRPPIQKKNHSIRATFHTAWVIFDRGEDVSRSGHVGYAPESGRIGPTESGAHIPSALAPLIVHTAPGGGLRIRSIGTFVARG